MGGRATLAEGRELACWLEVAVLPDPPSIPPCNAFDGPRSLVYLPQPGHVDVIGFRCYQGQSMNLPMSIPCSLSTIMC